MILCRKSRSGKKCRSHFPKCSRHIRSYGSANLFNTLSLALVSLLNTGRFIMFSVITNIYNKKTKGPTLMELFTATGKLKEFSFLTNRDVRSVHHWWQGTHRYDIQVVATHASACVATTWISYRCVPCHPWCTDRTSLVVKKTFSFRVAVNNSIKVGHLIFLL